VGRATAALPPLAEPTLRLMEKPGYDPFRTPLDLPQWRAQWALWRGV
jgi:15-cis-phytoene synthase